MLVAVNVVPAISGYTSLLTTDMGYAIKGKVSQLGGSKTARVRLFEKMSGRLIMEKKTHKDGTYIFPHLKQGVFTIVTHHPEQTFNAVIQDNVVPK